MSVTNRFPEWGKTGEEPPLGFEYSGGDQVNEKHLNYLWSAIKLQTDDFIDRTDEIEAELQSEVTRLEDDIDDNTTDITSLETSFNDHSDRHHQGGPDELDASNLSGAAGQSEQVLTSDGTSAFWETVDTVSDEEIAEIAMAYDFIGV